MSNTIINMALYTKSIKNTKTTQHTIGIGCNIKINGDEKINFIYNDNAETYGQLLLKKLIHLSEQFLKHSEQLKGEDPLHNIKLITAQPNTKNIEVVCSKFSRIFVDALKQKQEITLELVKKLVLKDGRYDPRPNDELYAQLIYNLCQLAEQKIYFSYEKLPKSETIFELLKELNKEIDPNQVLFKYKPKKKQDK